MDEKQNIIDELLAQFKEQRVAILDMIVDLEKIKANIDKLIPESLDSRYVRFFEEKVKTVTEVFKTLLDMRKEIQKSLKEELDIRRKINATGGDNDDVESYLDIRKLAAKVEQFKDARDKAQKDSIKLAQEETDKVASELVKVVEQKIMNKTEEA
jgi:hypothetical protein